MPSGIEAALVKPIVDAFLALYKNSKGTKLKHTAEAALSEAIRELLSVPTDLHSTEAKIAVAKAAGIINADLILAEELISKHKLAARNDAAKRNVRPVRKRTVPRRKQAPKK
ncbi:MAG: hypothetical protein Q8L89_00815 [Gammaproteobacteria bacterium]|nr:hypothetical protein [Gammaproteobacteria bacterium]